MNSRRIGYLLEQKTGGAKNEMTNHIGTQINKMRDQLIIFVYLLLQNHGDNSWSYLICIQLYKYV